MALPRLVSGFTMCLLDELTLIQSAKLFTNQLSGTTPPV